MEVQMELKLSKKSMSSLSKMSREAKRKFMSNQLNRKSDLVETKDYFETPSGCRGNCGGDCAGYCKGSCSSNCRGFFMYS